jgi:putative ABC transport system permease protein
MPSAHSLKRTVARDFAMLRYYMRLALKSFARTPGMISLMILAVAVGIATCIVTLTMYRAMAGNPIWWKSERLFSVTMDSWSIQYAAHQGRPHLPPTQLTYNDATFLFGSNIPTRKLITYRTTGAVTGGVSEHRPLRVTTRFSTADFFSMFDVPFRYGSGWSAKADAGPEPVIVLSYDFNERLFGGENSIGRTIRWNEREFRIIGVMGRWAPRPKFYDLNNGHFDGVEDVFIPFSWGIALEKVGGGKIDCWKVEPMRTFKDYLGSECVWLEMWMELPTLADREAMQRFIDTYWQDQRKAGRFQRPRNNRLTSVSQWLRDQEVVRDDNRVLVGLALAFFTVCLLNTIGLLLAKFLNGAPVSGVRRALGASRKDLFWQHLVEAGLIALAAAMLGLLLGALGLRALRMLYATSAAGYGELAQFSTTSLAVAGVLALVAVLIAGVYPAWRVGRMPPAVYLRSQ